MCASHGRRSEASAGDDAEEVLRAGALRICAVSAIVGSDDPEAVSRDLRRMIDAAWERAADRSSNPGSERMSIRLNGAAAETEARTLQQLVELSGSPRRRIVAEADGRIVERGRWSETELRADMEIELVHFVGGG